MLYQFDFETIVIATESFSKANKISQHRFGFTYKGWLQNGQGIAIARPHSNSECEEYINELPLLVKLEHENLAHLFGYCIEKTRVLFVFGFTPYASLDLLIFDPLKCIILDWNKRYKILLGVASVLVYLHKHVPIQIVHGNVNPGNILLDESLHPKLSDFEMSRCLETTESYSFDDNVVRRTRAYMAPEYLINGHLSTKVDVFSFGVLVLVTISGLRTHDYISRVRNNFLQYVWKNWLEGTSSNTIEPTISADSSSIMRFIHIGLLCVQDDVTERPTMEEVVGMLVGSSYVTLPFPKMPPMPPIVYGSHPKTFFTHHLDHFDQNLHNDY